MTPERSLLGAAELRSLLREAGVIPQRSLGQNFVVDPNTIRKMVSLSGAGDGERVLEIGAGAGSLTLGLVGAGAHVVAVEKDDRLVHVLRSVLPQGADVEVVHEDALEMDLARFRADRLVANLPYNIAATVVLKALDDADSIRALTVMTQREVGERFAAGPGTKVYGQTSVMVRCYGTPRVVGRVSRRAFYPVPNVDSVIVGIERHDAPLAADVPLFRLVVKAAFAQRRKTIRNALEGALDAEAGVATALRASGIDPTVRAEDLSIHDFVRLAESFGGEGQGLSQRGMLG